MKKTSSEEKTMSKAAQIRAYQKANPTATAKEVALALNVKPVTVHQVRWAEKKKGVVKRGPGRPPRNAVTVSPSQGQIVLRGEMSTLHERMEALKEQNLRMRGVIAYLESKLGINNGFAI